jgi:hypothetical protein
VVKQLVFDAIDGSPSGTHTASAPRTHRALIEETAITVAWFASQQLQRLSLVTIGGSNQRSVAMTGFNLLSISHS